MKKLFSFALVTLMTTSLLAKRDQEFLLRYNLKPGSTYTMTSDMDMFYSMSNGGVTMSFNVISPVSYKVLSLEGDIYDMTMTMNVGNCEIEVGGVEMERQMGGLESQRMISDITKATMEAMQGQTFGIKMSTRGKIVEITAIGQMLEQMIDRMANALIERFPGSTEEREQMKSMIIDKLHDNKRDLVQQFDMSLRNSLSNSNMEFPESALKIGQTWHTSMGSDSFVPGLGLTINTETKLAGKRGKTLVIETNGSIASDAGINGLLSGVIVIDADSGWPVSGRTEMEINGSDGFPVDIRLTVTISE